MTTTYGQSPQRTNVKAQRELLKHAEPVKVLSTFGDQKELPKNSGETIAFRRALPIDAGANGAPNVNASDYLIQEGVTPGTRGITWQDIVVTPQQYGVLMKTTSKSEDQYEDDIPAAMITVVGEHMGELEELITYGVVRGGTNVLFSNGVSRAQVTTTLTLNKLRAASRAIDRARGKKVTQKLAPGVNFGTEAIEASYLVFVHTDQDADVRGLPGFVPTVSYGTRSQIHEQEIGAVEKYRFIVSPLFRPFFQAGGNAAAGTVLSNGEPCSGANATDVYSTMVVARDAYGSVALKGKGAIDVTHLKASEKTKADPMGLYGYVSATFVKGAVRLNEAWMARIECGAGGLL